MTTKERGASPRWRRQDLANATAKAIALAMLTMPVVGVVANDEPRAPRDGRAEAA